MKAAVFFDDYLPFHETKDPGLIPLGLNRIGCNTHMITVQKSELCAYNSPFSIMTSDKERFREINFWRRVDADIIICYTWLNRAYNPILAAIGASRKKVVVKADSDGRIGYPVIPRQSQSLVKSPFRNAWQRVGFRFLFGSFMAARRAEQIRMANAILIESPKALDNVSMFFKYWRQPNLVSSFHFIPNCVSDDITSALLRKKKNVVVSVGRWKDPAKNTPMMLRCSNKFLRDNPGWRLRLVGEGQTLLQNSISRWQSNLRERVEILGPVPHSRMAQVLGESRILFMPSRWEGSPIVASEAACMGCTVVGTPLESLDFLAADGFSGTLAESFSHRDLVRALELDARRHEQGAYDPAEIASHWRAKFCMHDVAKQIYELLTRL
jgi:glycosyltransferase involved in cell wall biosynthesis